ncbi:hypothetical protein D3C83_75020 [compost metagenome]
MAVKALQARKQPGRARCARLALVKNPEVRLYVRVARGKQVLAILLFQPRGILREISAVTVERVLGEPVLEPQRITEFIDQTGITGHRSRLHASAASA